MSTALGLGSAAQGGVAHLGESHVRILLLTQVVPFPPDSGPKIKTLNVLRHLAQQHDVHLVTFVRSEAEEAAAQSLRRYCTTVDTVPLRRSRWLDVAALIRSCFTGRPVLVERDDSAELRSRVAQLLSRYQIDAVHADQLTMGQFAVDLPVPLRMLDEHNAVWTIVRRAARHEGWGPRRLVAEREWRRLRAYEGQLCLGFDRVLVVSEEDRRDLEAAAGTKLQATVVPITVDAEALAFRPRTSEARHVLSMATMFYPPNVEAVEWFAREAFPRVRAGAPGTTFYVVGSRPPAHIKQLGEADLGIDVTGYVDDLEPYLRRSALLVVPLHSGSGMRVKILEAFSRGLPVVSTTVGVEGIEARHGEHLLVADTPEQFARAVLDVLNDPESARQRADAARRLVEERYDSRCSLRALDAMYGIEGAATPAQASEAPTPASVAASHVTGAKS
jgi:glycosyltransferase involved in cell wall biosynthesis